MIRDDEIQRLIHYAKGLGVKITMHGKSNKDADGAWTLDGTEIHVYGVETQTKIDIVLTLIHELGHMVWFIHERERKWDLKFEEALDRQNLFDCDLSGTPAPKKLRKRIYENEVAATGWWHSIYKDTAMKFPLWKLELQRDFDTWQYEVYFKTGHFPTNKIKAQKLKELKSKYKETK